MNTISQRKFHLYISLISFENVARNVAMMHDDKSKMFKLFTLFNKHKQVLAHYFLLLFNF